MEEEAAAAEDLLTARRVEAPPGADVPVASAGAASARLAQIASQPRLSLAPGSRHGSWRQFTDSGEEGPDTEEGAEDEFVEAWEIGQVHWSPVRKLALMLMLLLLVLLGGAESIAYTVNGKVTMAPYRCFLDQLVVTVSMVFFFAMDWLDRVRRRGARPTSSGGRRGYAYSEDYSYHSADGASVWSEQDRSPLLAGHATDAAGLELHSEPRHLLWMVFLMALCDTISLYVNLLASHNLGGALRLILQQLSIPISMLLSYVILGRTFSGRHVLGAVAVGLGVVLCMVNVLNKTPGQESSPMWTLLFGCSCVPLALGGCLKEWVLLRKRCSANWLNAWVASFQLVLGLCLVPLGIAIQNVDMDVQVGMDEILDNFWAGFKCGCLGIDSTEDPAGLVPLYGQDHCARSLVSTWLYVFAVCAFNLLMLAVIREGTAVLFFVANGVIIPLVSLLSASPLYKALGLHADKFTPWQVLGLCLTVLGCVFFGAAMIQRSESDMRKEIMASTSSRYSRFHSGRLTPRFPAVASGAAQRTES